MRILLIDDNDLLRDGARRHLARLGHEVLVARDGVEGLRLATSSWPDRIICDYEMPGLDGSEVYERLPAELQERLFLWSGSPPTNFARPDHVIAKPCNVFELMSLARIA